MADRAEMVAASERRRELLRNLGRRITEMAEVTPDAEVRAAHRHIYGIFCPDEVAEREAYRHWVSRPNVTPRHFTQRAVSRCVMDHYPEREPETPIFCRCGHTFTISAATPIHPFDSYKCCHCGKLHGLPEWNIYAEGDVA
jgi:hypothetical protein